MTLGKLIDKMNEAVIDKVVLDYDGCKVEFETLWDLMIEAYDTDIIVEQVKEHKLRKTTLLINM